MPRFYPKHFLPALAISDLLGFVASAGCLIHCHLNTVLFLFGAYLQDSMPNYWSHLDYPFLLLSFMAVWKSSNATLNKLIQIGFWIPFTMLAIGILFEDDFAYCETLATVGSILLSVVHLLNLRFCKYCR